MRSTERRKVNVLEIKCLETLTGVSRTDKVNNEEVRIRAGMEIEFASRADQNIGMVWARGENGLVPYG